ncbi:MAG: DUF167 domain-containing protein [Candidatus Thermoplasmatota archaeon]
MAAKEKSDLSDTITDGKRGVYLDIAVSPGSSEQSILGLDPWRGEVKVAVKERAEEGRANEAIVEFFAEILGTEKNKIQIAKGRKTKQKRLFFSGVEDSKLEAELSKRTGGER